ncbi:PREDICTED: protein REVEILLE 3-like isoform X2 [Tarenaya hassleriana]|uniref:protein REVEILLE 3-like isoform X2 n=1 Tax=Tarenaya hassleriana TaxID=28532 RepID=UPI00053C8228|nr:PREDICTED: protein REVEILLE 3-like isoform X2 [Tarenaya hassleriana]
MVSVAPNSVREHCLFDPIMKSGLSSRTPTAETAAKAPGDCSPAAGGKNSLPFPEDSSKRTRKLYTMTKSRESWSEQEHDRFLEALQLFDRDWKKIEAFVGSKSVIQIRSHAQKYFLKVQKNGTGEHVPPPRPKRKATRPYPQKAPKNAAVSQPEGRFQASAGSVELMESNKRMPLWIQNSVAVVNTSPMANGILDKERLYAPMVAKDSCYSSSNESAQKDRRFCEPNDQLDKGRLIRVMPDFSQVYSFLGSVFDPNATDHLQRLKQMDPINLETALLLMRNLNVNLNSSEFEKYWLSFYGSKVKRSNSGPEYDDMQTGDRDRAVASA